MIVALFSDHIKDIQLLVIEIIVPFYFEPTHCIHLNEKLDKWRLIYQNSAGYAPLVHIKNLA